MKTQNIALVLSLFNIFLLAGAIYFFAGQNKTEEASAYVDVIELYKSFDMTKELDRRFSSFQSQQTGIKDSLQTIALQIEQQFKNGNQSLQPEALSKLSTIQVQMAGLEQANEEMRADFEKQIWAQINTYIEDFGHEKDYQIILGATGQGSLLYAESTLDITAQMSSFINDKYNGKL